jgi:hypothetical protein
MFCRDQSRESCKLFSLSVQGQGFGAAIIYFRPGIQRDRRQGRFARFGHPADIPEDWPPSSVSSAGG